MTEQEKEPAEDHGQNAPGVEGPPPGVQTMAVLRWLLVAVMAVIAVLSVVHSYGHVHADADEKSQQFYCPMHPQIVQNQPGDCPICHMTLVPKPAAKQTKQADAKPARAKGSAPSTDMAESAQGVPGLVPVQLELDRVQLIGVRTAKVTREALTPELQAVGYVAPDESKFARVHARFSGWVEKLAVATTGQKVRRGQVLASIYNIELLPAQQEFLAARKWNAETATSNTAVTGSLAEDARKRLELLGMSSAEIDRIAQSGMPSRTVAVVAPIGGTIMRKEIVEGSYIQPGTALFEIADLSKVWVIAEIYEHEMSRVAQGQTARFETEAYKGQSFGGKVAFIYPTVDPSTRTLRIRVELDNKTSTLLPGMYGTLSMQLGHADGIVIPVEALVDTGEHQYVFLAQDGGRFDPRRVQSGARVGDMVQIQQGLREGDMVVTTGNFMIDSESRLRAAIESKPPN